jgi:hypothetical protein
MKYIIWYYIIGVVVSAYMIWHYRGNKETKRAPKESDGIGALIGPWVWPIQIALHYFLIRKKRIS